MTAKEAKIGQKYLTKTGVPVTPVEQKGDKVVVRVETTGNKIEVDKTYDLKPFNEAQVSKDAKLLLKAKGRGKDSKTEKKVREGSFAALIDPMLLSGKFTIKQMDGELQRAAGSLCKGKNVQANIRARLFSYRRKGWTVEKDAGKRIRIVQKKSK